MLSTLPKLIDKAFLVGFVVPLILFVACMAVAFPDVPQITAISDAMGEGLEKAAYVGAIVWFGAVLLMIVNSLLYQILEGYRWPTSHFATWRKKNEQQCARLTGQIDDLNRRGLREGESFPDYLSDYLDQLRIDRNKRFPSSADQILPTRFGNAIRAFEDYPRQVYGADSIPLWLHLSTVIPNDYQSIVEDARSQVDCLLNCFYLSICFAIFSITDFAFCLYKTVSNDIVYVLIYILFSRDSNYLYVAIACILFAYVLWALIGSRIPAIVALIVSIPPSARFVSSVQWPDRQLHNIIVSISTHYKYAAFAILAMIATRIFYELSVERIYIWGAFVKAAFDCYLPALAKKLGYELPEKGETAKSVLGRGQPTGDFSLASRFPRFASRWTGRAPACRLGGIGRRGGRRRRLRR